MSNNDMILFENNVGLPSVMQGMVDEIGGDLSGGIAGSYAILAIKGGRFSVKHQGQMTPVTNEQGDPVGSFEAVLVKSNPYLTKQYYAKGYVEGDSAAPDCFSIDGKVPSNASPAIQHTNCAGCPMNTFSKINESTGKKTKPCQDNKKMAVLPADDLVNELYGGPMLMRIPAASLKDLAMFGDTLKSRGYPYNAVRVRLSFDLTVSYPKLIFKAVRPLTEDEAVQVLEWYNSDAVAKMLADFEDITVPPQAAIDEVFEQPPQAPPVAAPTPPAAKPQVKAAAPAQAPKAPAAPPATAPKAPGATFGKPAAAAPKAAPAAPKPPVVKAKPAAPAPAPAPVVSEAGEEVDTTTEIIPGNLENDIAGILDELNAIAGDQ